MSLFHQRKPRPFNLKYRVYDEQKERLRESEARVRKQMGMESTDPDAGRTLKYGVFRNSIDDLREDKSRKTRYAIIFGLIILFSVLFISKM